MQHARIDSYLFYTGKKQVAKRKYGGSIGKVQLPLVVDVTILLDGVIFETLRLPHDRYNHILMKSKHFEL